MQCTDPCCFVHHSSFLDELGDFVSKYGSSSTSVEETLGNIQRLLVIHFFNRSPKFTPKHIGVAQGFSGFTVYWIHLVIPECKLSRTQFPKAYFYKTDGHISFLCLDSHMQNYKDAKLRMVASDRLKDMIELLRTHKS